MDDRHTRLVELFTNYFNCYQRWKYHPTRESEKFLIRATRALYSESREQWRDLRDYAVNTRIENKQRAESLGQQPRGRVKGKKYDDGKQFKPSRNKETNLIDDE
jgi:hypothetical protein